LLPVGDLNGDMVTREATLVRWDRSYRHIWLTTRISSPLRPRAATNPSRVSPALPVGWSFRSLLIRGMGVSRPELPRW